MNLTDDPRWQRFNDKNFHCACCGRGFQGVFAMAFDHPDVWNHGSFRDNGGQKIIVGGDALGSDLCKVGDSQFVRGEIKIPIQGSNTYFPLGVWSSLSADNFDAYIKAYGTSAELEIQPCFGWLSNELPVFGNGNNLKLTVTFLGGGQRPNFTVFDESSRLSDDQINGISFDELLDIYAAFGTDLRPHLLGH